MSWPAKQSPLTNQLILWLPPLASQWSNKVGLTSTPPHYINPLTKHMETHTHTHKKQPLAKCNENVSKTNSSVRCCMLTWRNWTPLFCPTGKQRGKIPQVSFGRHPYGRHAQHQEHVGERRREQPPPWKSGSSKQGETGCRRGSDALSGIRRNIKGDNPSQLFQDVAGIKGSVAGRGNSWKGKPAEAEKTPAPAPAPAAAPSPPAAAKPPVRPDESFSSCSHYNKTPVLPCDSNLLIFWAR